MVERVSDEWIDAFVDDDKYGMIMCGVFAKNVILCMKELQARRKAEKEHGHTDNSASEKDGAGATQEKPVLPIPCTKGFEKWTVKQWFAKINEELDELKADVMVGTWNIDCSVSKSWCQKENCTNVAEEAADTITAITSMLEAMGIDERQRKAAQKLVNEHNRQRGRI